ncbi:hypothetical protein HMPREF2544_02140 [Staphylococcus sp. HMSC063A11]|uniref:BglII/BstYI family type II restriction endonuclease n=1 Tax=unclassified Staphylococcus TaxID=91994 RepID=UPI0008A98CA7|nr:MULTISPECIES: BglII/BstYI family type II restriction endonuclease [unclassified Staphylococcus]OHP84018.1 hypothetical protein HMPREF2544_02140 [Staphylococcus sp. HMSC063A11]OHR96944.1 hypothetical protein HMPREF3246_03600 [Staphylococcus sp. HMSC36A02]HDF0488306.1 hypothetical protein [Staphylococcus aureus]
MKYAMYSHRYAYPILQTDREFFDLWSEIKEVLEVITEDDIINHFNFRKNNGIGKDKSISKTINNLLKEKFIEREWFIESPIFQSPDYTGDTWRLDFAKENISIEVGFNHSSVIAWNLLKPVLASELNHVQKAIQTKVGVIISVTDSMKKAGGFDNAISTYEKYIDYLKPLSNQLSVPLLIIGIKAPDTFFVKQEKVSGKYIGTIIKKENYDF